MKSILIKSVCIVVTIVIGIVQPRVPQPTFVIEKPNHADSNCTTKIEPFAESSFVDVPTPCVHASTITELPNGQFMLAWFGGTKEGAPDVKIYSCLMDSFGKMSKPTVLLDRQTLQSQTGRYIRKLGNPLLFFHDGRLHFFVVSVSVGGWSGSAINHAYSDDLGKTWSPFKRLQLSPLFNISTLVRCPPVWLSDNYIGLPIYHEFICKYGEWVILNEEGRIAQKSRIHYDLRSLQPCVAVVNQTDAIALLRNGYKKGGQVKAVMTTDAGQSWKPFPNPPIENPDSCLAMLKLDDNTLLLVGNPIEGRSTLNLWKSNVKNMAQWTLCTTLEHEPDTEFSYPTLIKDSQNRVHLIYTWKRKTIRHRILNPVLWEKDKTKNQVDPAENSIQKGEIQKGDYK